MLLENILFFGLLLVMLAMLLFIPKTKQTRRFGVTVLATALLLELFVFNFHSYHLIFGDYEKQTLDLSQASITGNYQPNADGTLKITDNATIEYKNIGTQIGTVYFDVDWQTSDGQTQCQYVEAVFDFMDETQSAYYRSNIAEGTVVNGAPRSNTVVMALSGEVSHMRVELTTQEGTSVTLKQIAVNAPVPFHFSILRLLLIVLIPLALYALLEFPAFTDSVLKRKHILNTVVICITAVLVLIAFAITACMSFEPGVDYGSRFQAESGNQITQKIVDAFTAGQVELLQTPSQELLALENPYDWSLRYSTGVTALWDHLLYEGKYYSYYGIAPVLLLYWPYHQLTGYYFPAAESILLFGAIGIIFLSALFIDLIKKFFPRLPVNLAVFSLLILQASSGIWYCFAYDNFYEIAQSCGFMFTCAGFYFLLRSGVVGAGEIRKPSLILSSFCLSMAVLSRPTLALYCVVALLFLVFGFVKLWKGSEAVGRKKTLQAVGYWTAALTCYVIIGGIQMLYNYLRFGNILDFGIQYSLTINDFTKAQYHTDFAAIGFWNFLFAFPKIELEFPFIFSNFSDLSVNGYYFVANTNAIGLFWRALPMFWYLGAVSVCKQLDKTKKLSALLLIGSCCVAAPLIIIFSIWESGYGVRYSADFAWQMVIGAMMISFFRYTSMEEDPYKADRRQMMIRFYAASAIVALVVNFALIYDYLPLEKLAESRHYVIESVFEFWK